MSPQAGQLLVNEIVPRLRSAVPNAVCLVGCEDAEELVQDATAMAARMLHNAEAAGKRVTPGNIAYYTIQHLKSGRRSTGSSTVDVLQSGTQLNGRTNLVSLDQVVRAEEDTDETFTLGDVLSTDEEDPAVIATRKLDWSAFCATQPERSQAILGCAATGGSLTGVARRHRVSRSAIEHNRQNLAREIRQFMGEDILTEVARPPAWKHNLVAAREKTAWKKTK
jgi:hypothetical protein